jgi:DNA polymerase III subunit alpha
MIRFQ